MTTSQRKIIITILMITIACTLAIFWYLGALYPGNTLQSGEKPFTEMEFHSLYPGTVFVSDITIENPVETAPERMMVYSKQPMSESDILKTATTLGVSGEPVNESGWISIREEPYAFISQPGGRVIILNDETPISDFPTEYIDSHLPSDADAKKIADEFLSRHNIELDGMRFIGTSHNVGYFIGKDVKIKNSESINVAYRHFINGSEIFNDKLGLEVTVNGTVKTMFLKWTRYQPYREYALITPEQAVEALHETGLAVPEGIEKPEKATVRNITLGYLGETTSQDLDYLIPVYMIEGTVYGNGSAEFIQYIPASPEAAAQLI